MDPESARLVRDSIHDLRSANRAIMICTHNLYEAEELADKIAIIMRGKIIALGSVDSLKKELLGPEEYEARLGLPLDGKEVSLPGDLSMTGRGPNWLRYRTTSPEQENPRVLLSLFDQGYPVVSLQEVPRSLENVYLQAIGSAGRPGDRVSHAG